MANQGRGVQMFETQHVATKQLEVGTVSSRDSFLLPDVGNLRSLTPMTTIVMISFAVLGILVAVTWSAIETMFTLQLIGVVVVLGFIGSAMTTVFLWIAGDVRPRDPVGVFFGWFMVLFLLPTLLTLGIVFYYFESDTRDFLTAKYADQEYWQERYPETSLESAIQNGNFWMTAMGLACLAMFVLIMIVFIPMARATRKLRNSRVLLEIIVFSVVLNTLALGMRSMLVLNLFDEKLLIEAVNRSNSEYLLIIAVIMLILAFVLEYVIGEQQRKLTIAIAFVLLFCAVIALWFGGKNYFGARNYEYKEGEVDYFVCADILARTSDAHLSNIGCTQKFQPLDSCPPGGTIVDDWDNDGAQCLNENCCTVLRNEVIRSIAYTGVEAFCIVSMAVLVVLTAFYVVEEFDLYGADSKWDKFILVFVVLITLGVGSYGIYIFGIQKSTYPGDKPIPGHVADAGYVAESLLLAEPLWYQNNFTSISFEEAVSEDDSFNVLYVDITSDSVDLQMDMYHTVITKHSPRHIAFETSSEQVAVDLMSAVRYCSKCLDIPGTANVTATLVEYLRGAAPEDMYDGDDMNDNMDDNGMYILASNTIMQESVSIPSNAYFTQEIYGKVLDEIGELENVYVTVVVPGCDKYLITKTNGKGEYAIKLPVNEQFSPYMAPIKFSKDEYKTLETEIQIGGIPTVTRKWIPKLTMSSTNANGRVILSTFDAVTNDLLEPRIVLTNINGTQFEDLNALSPGLYSLPVAEKGYFTSIAKLNVVGGDKIRYNMSLEPKNLAQDEIAVTLTWDDQIKNIDLNVIFNVNETDTCHVWFNQKQWGGAKLEGFTVRGGSLGGESIRLKLAPSYYLFYVKAKGGNDDPFPLSLSHARINVYSAYSDTQLLSLEMPEGAINTNVWLAFCVNGLKGPDSAIPLYTARVGEVGNMLQYCENAYGPLDTSPGFNYDVDKSVVVYDLKSP